MPDTIETAVRKVLTDASGVTDLVSTRIFPLTAPQSSTKPFVVYEIDSLEPEDSLGGHSGLTHADISISCWASTYASAKDVAAKVRTALMDFTGTSDSVRVYWASHDNSRDAVVWPNDGTEMPVYGVEQDWRVAFDST